MRTLLPLVVAVLAAPAFASSWSSYEQLEGASRVNLRADLESLHRDSGASFTGARGADGVPSADGGDSSAATRVEKPTLSRKDKIEPPSPSEAKTLKIARAAGIGAAVIGLGVVAFSVATGGGLPLLALAAVFVGGLTAYLAHRRLSGKSKGFLG